MITNELYKDYLRGLLLGNRKGCIEIVQTLLSGGIQMRELYIDLFQRSLYDVGTLWETNQISVAVEHLATALTESLIDLSYPSLFAAEHVDKKAVISCTPGEFHQVGARMVADCFELNGWDGYFLGSNTPINELIAFIRQNEPDVLAISMSVYYHLSSLTKLIISVREEFPDLVIIIGGQGFRWGGAGPLITERNVQIIKSLDELERTIINSPTYAA